MRPVKPLRMSKKISTCNRMHGPSSSTNKRTPRHARYSLTPSYPKQLSHVVDIFLRPPRSLSWTRSSVRVAHRATTKATRNLSPLIPCY
jgi:hypothetical protein